MLQHAAHARLSGGGAAAQHIASTSPCSSGRERTSTRIVGCAGLAEAVYVRIDARATPVVLSVDGPRDHALLRVVVGGGWSTVGLSSARTGSRSPLHVLRA